MNKEEKELIKETISLGQYLSQKRKEKGINLEKISQDTKILTSYLKALEEDNFSVLPPPTYLKAIVKKYARYLELNEKEVLELLKKSNHRQWVAGKTDKLPTNRFFVPQIKLVSILRFLISFILKYLFLLLIISYFLYQLSYLVLPPKIILFHPEKDLTTTQKEITISGKAIRAKTVYFKNQPLTLNENGTFTYTLNLNPGLNQIEIKATNHLGYEVKVIRNINYLSSENQ